MKKKVSKDRLKPIPEEKKKYVSEIVNLIKSSHTVLIASTKGLPASQFQKIKSKLRKEADIRVIKKSVLLRAISQSEKGVLQNLKEKIPADSAVMFSNLDSFELSGILTDNLSPTKARPGDIAPEDISIEPGPTDLIPGPAISELSSVGLKVVVEGGKLAIKTGAVVVKKGDKIKDNVASVLGKLKINPMKVGFIPLFAYDLKHDKLYEEIKIDKKGALDELRFALSKAMGFAVNLSYTTKETISYLISRAVMHEKALASKTTQSVEEGQ